MREFRLLGMPKEPDLDSLMELYKNTKHITLKPVTRLTPLLKTEEEVIV